MITMAIAMGCLGISNYRLGKKVALFQEAIYSSMVTDTDTAMKLETALQMLSTEGPREVERIARDVAKQEIKKELSESKAKE